MFVTTWLLVNMHLRSNRQAYLKQKDADVKMTRRLVRKCLWWNSCICLYKLRLFLLSAKRSWSTGDDVTISATWCSDW